MSDIQAYMQQKLDEFSKKNPNNSYCFISTHPDEYPVRTQVDGWKPVAGEVRCGDLILAERPREMSEAERKRNLAKTRGLIHAAEAAFVERVIQDGAGGRYLQPLTPAALARDKDLPPNPK